MIKLSSHSRFGCRVLHCCKTSFEWLFCQNILKSYIERSGLDVVQRFEHEGTVKNPEEYIEALVQVRNGYCKLIHDAFNSHSLMRTALDQVPYELEKISISQVQMINPE